MDSVAQVHANIVDVTATPKGSIAPLPNQATISSRATQRMERLAALENEMRAEEKEALELLLTKAQTKALMRTFDSVKTEFSDLDGMKWDKRLIPSSGSVHTPRHNKDENAPPSLTTSRVAFPSSMSLPTLYHAPPPHEEPVLSSSSQTSLRYKASQATPARTSFGSSDSDCQLYLYQYHDKGVRNRTSTQGLVISDNIDRNSPTHHPRTTTPFSHDRHASLLDVDSTYTIKNRNLTGSEGNELYDLTIRSPRTNKAEARASASFLFGLGVQWSPGLNETA